MAEQSLTKAVDVTKGEVCTHCIACLCRKTMGPNEVDVKDLQSLPNASKKDGAAPAIQQYGKTPKSQVYIACLRWLCSALKGKNSLRCEAFQPCHGRIE